ncbi:MAG: AAA family ATPase [Verrucomicrobiota bacterium]
MKNTFITAPEVPSSDEGLVIHHGLPSLSHKDYYHYIPDPADNLLGNEFLCRKGLLIIAGPSHVGKSSLSVQQDVLWSLGRPAFGISPSRPLRILTFQAENDASSMHLAARGVIDTLKLTSVEINQVADATACISIRSCSGSAFLDELDKELNYRSSWSPDIIRLDPLMAFIGDDPANTKAVLEFMRGGLNAIIEKYNVGAICTHHTTKTQYMDTDKFKPYDFQYCMAGTADLTNLARSVIAIIPCKDGKTFGFMAAKGKAKIGWGAPSRYFAHAVGKIFWEEVGAPSAPSRTSTTRTATPEKLLSLFGADLELKKDDLLARCPAADIGQNVARDLIALLTSVKDGRLEQFEKPRPGARPEVWLRLTSKALKTAPTEAQPIKPWSADDDDIPF